MFDNYEASADIPEMPLTIWVWASDEHDINEWLVDNDIKFSFTDRISPIYSRIIEDQSVISFSHKIELEFFDEVDKLLFQLKWC